LAASPQARDLEHDLEKMSEQAKRRMTNSILTRQFISEQSEADKLFGKPLVAYSSEPQKAFHYPVRQDMIAMLDQPMPEVPFAYTPRLINFAYDPGLKGDLQPFWDVITQPMVQREVLSGYFLRIVNWQHRNDMSTACKIC